MPINWTLIQSFYAVAEHGSLSKAAASMNTSQPTLSRQIALLEKQLCAALFERSTQGLKITEAGVKLLESSHAMQQASEAFMRVAAGSDLSLTGSVRISANEVIGLYYLPDAIIAFNRQFPEIKVEVDISNQSTSLHKREADIALRMFRPSQPELIARRLPDIKLNLTASSDYIDQYGYPENLNDISQHNLIGYDKQADFVKSIEQINNALLHSFHYKTGCLPLQIELARKGAGITITHQYLIEQWEELELIEADLRIPNLEFWLVAHADVKKNHKIRVAMTFLADYFEKLLNPSTNQEIQGNSAAP